MSGVNDSDSDEHVRSRSSHHTRSNSVTFITNNPQGDSTTGRTSSPSHRHSVRLSTRGAGPSSSSRPNSNAHLSPPKRTHSTSMGEPSGGETSRAAHLSKRSDGSKKKRSSRKSGGRRDVRAIDYGLGLLDDPALLDPATKARIAELESRIEEINPAPLPPPPEAELPPPRHDPPRTPPPSQPAPLAVDTPPRIAFSNAAPASPMASTTPSIDEGSPLRPPSAQRGRLTSLMTDVKDRFGNKQQPPKSRPRLSSSADLDPSRVMAELRAEARIQKLREAMQEGTKDRAQSVKEQLEARYLMIFDALEKHEPPPNLLSVVRWRREMSDARRRDLRRLAMTDIGVSRDTHARPSDSLSPSSAQKSNGMLPRTESTDYATESSRLQWLPHLSSLHSRFMHPTNRKDMKEWHVTAQVVHDYLLHFKDPIPTASASPLPARSDRLAPSTKSKSPRPSTEGDSRPASLELSRQELPLDLERVVSVGSTTSAQQGKRKISSPPGDNTSPKSSVQGFRISLTGLTNLRDPRRVFTTKSSSRPTSPIDGPSSPPFGATEFSFSPTSSRHDLVNMRRTNTGGNGAGGGPLSEDLGSSEMSMSDGVTDTDDPFARRRGGPGAGGARRPIHRRTAESSRQDLMLSSTSDEDASRVATGKSVGGRMLVKPRWATPLFSRRNTERLNAPVQEAPSEGVGQEVEEEVVMKGPNKKLAVETHAYTADFLAQFPRVEYRDPDDVSQRWETMQRRQREHYTQRATLLHHLRVQNAHLDRLGTEARIEITEFIRVRKLLSSETGFHEEDISTDVLQALEPFPPHPNSTGPALIEALHSHRLTTDNIAKRFLQLARAGKVAWLHPVTTGDPRQLVEMAYSRLGELEKDWTNVQEKVLRLRETQDRLTDLMTRLNRHYDRVALEIDTAYPELVRTVDLARQLSVTGQTTLPYISTLPPWAREVLGPFVDYTLELIGLLIRLIIYPIYRLLPRPLRWVLAVFFFLVLGVTSSIFAAIWWFFGRSYAFGEWLARFRFFRSGTLFSIFVLNRAIDVYKVHWRSMSTFAALAVFWWLTTPEDESYYA